MSGLLNAEDLRLVGNGALRATLADFALRVGRLQGVLGQQMGFVLGEWRPFGIEYLDYRGGRSPTFRDEPSYPQRYAHRRDGSGIAASPEFEGLLDLSLIQNRGVIGRAAEVLEQVPTLREALNKRLAAL